MPSFLAVPAFTSSTARTGPPEGTSASDSGTVFSAMRRMRPSPRIKIMSSGMKVFFIQNLVRSSRWKSNSIPCPSGSSRRNMSPLACCSGVEASSTAKTCTPFLLAISSGCSSAAGSRPALPPSGRMRTENAVRRTCRQRCMTDGLAARAPIIAKTGGLADCAAFQNRLQRELGQAERLSQRYSLGSVRRRAGRRAFRAHLGRHQSLWPGSKAHENVLARPQFSQAEAAQRLHMNENVGGALAAGQEAEAPQPIEPLDLRSFEAAGRGNGDVGARRGHLRRMHRSRFIHREDTECLQTARPLQHLNND